jgi:hypothetical protein
MSEAKGPYKHSDYHRMTKAHSVSCLACAYEKGRSSRDGLRDLISQLLDAENEGTYFHGAMVKALEADGEEDK